MLAKHPEGSGWGQYQLAPLFCTSRDLALKRQTSCSVLLLGLKKYCIKSSFFAPDFLNSFSKSSSQRKSWASVLQVFDVSVLQYAWLKLISYCAELHQLMDPFNLCQACWSRNTLNTCRTLAQEVWWSLILEIWTDMIPYQQMFDTQFFFFITYIFIVSRKDKTRKGKEKYLYKNI